jgi:UrcA family protein
MNTKVHNRRLSAGRMLLISIAAALPFATQAGEPSRVEVDGSRVSVVVNYADLNLTERAGASTLYARLKRAAEKVCGQKPAPLELRASAAYGDCFESTLNKAVERVDSQQLYALHAEQGGQATVS